MQARQFSIFDQYFLNAAREIGLKVEARVACSDVKTTMICTPVLNRGPSGVRSPSDRLRREGDVMPICIRRRDHNYQEAQMVEREEIVDAACADSTACYQGQKPLPLVQTFGQIKEG